MPSITDARELVREILPARHQRLHVLFGRGDRERLGFSVGANDRDRSRYRWRGNGDYSLGLILGLHRLQYGSKSGRVTPSKREESAVLGVMCVGLCKSGQGRVFNKCEFAT